jgi:hypothetical protein
VHFGREVVRGLPADGLADIRAYAGPAFQKLFRENVFVMRACYVFVQIDDADREIQTFRKNDIIGFHADFSFLILNF